jgi:hypothetical protein
MRLHRLIAALTFMILGLLTVTAGAGAKTDLSSCPFDLNDPFSFRAVMPGGPLKGVCINTNHYRSVRVLSAKEQADFGVSDHNAFVIANFRHLERFWVAVIPTESIQDVVFQRLALMRIPKTNLKIPLFHSQLRYRMRPGSAPITLISQKVDPKDRVVLPLATADGQPQDFVLSLYGVRDFHHDGSAFNPLNGAGDLGQQRYGVAYAVQSLYDADNWVLKEDKPGQQYLIKFNPVQVLETFNYGIRLSPDGGMPEMYEIMHNNCINFVFRVINSAIHSDFIKSLILNTRIGRDFQSVMPETTLENIGLLDRQLPDIKDEFKTGIPKIQPTP